MMATTPCPRSGYRAVVFDLFGTLVDAPTAGDRRRAAAEIAAVVGIALDDVESVLVHSWTRRHDGRLPTLPALVAFLAGTRPRAAEALTRFLLQRAARRLEAECEVLDAIRQLRTHGLRLGLLSDASADIADAWTRCALAPLVDAAVFSCSARALKPDRRLYNRVAGALGIPPSEILYCGDGGGDELRGAMAVGMTAVQVQRRGREHALAFGEQPWEGRVIARIEELLTPDGLREFAS